MKSYNLLDEPWLPVRYTDGQVSEIGLMQVFADAGRITALAETAPPNLIALYRLLLAVTHRALTQQLGSWTVKDMVRYYREGLPVEAIHAYLEHWRERFYVFHPDWPFMQVALLATAEETSSKSKSWTQIALESSSGDAPVVFDHSVDTRPSSILVSRLMRYLLGFLQFVPGGLVQTIRRSDNAGALANTAAVLPLGKTLAQTLCLALHPAKSDSAADLPAWERTQPDISALCAEPTLASGPNDRYTRLSRAILLLADDEACRRVRYLRFAVGLALDDDEHAPDTMASYREGSLGMVRLSFSEGRAIWRDLSSLVPDASGKHAQPAAVLSYSNALLERLGDGHDWVTLMVLGLSSKQAKLLRWRVDCFELPQRLLAQEDAAELLRGYLRQSEELYASIRKTASLMLAKAMPDSDHKDTRSRARTIFDNGPTAAAYFSTLERRLPVLLESLATDQVGQADRYWQSSRLEAAEMAWGTVCRQLGDSARALRARAQSEPFYLGLIQSLRAHLASPSEETSHV
ncbi:type I-E CRISPR-associated protein Cse1/CasA [Herbaspirillum rubrisubalbicans]|uniref:type I-E CRISPR-associated protein Cse1/CasA n=1 Tax=Herbaspirillum rubrisubalbicans TaxID=80842 RepID=UPI001C1328A4|nr:type I-E CRISPR-associated protein Cse1/CasA [Herbaspirillum rubrisubalbicans]NQE51168.1 CRISPR-associated protein Cse1 [Herbaspirillum rubrisubalbicans]